MNVIILCLIKSDFTSVTRLFFDIRSLITSLLDFSSLDLCNRIVLARYSIAHFVLSTEFVCQ